MKQQNELRFNTNGKFKILCFGDLHERLVFANMSDKLKFNDMSAFMDASIKALKPDFIVFLGDTLCSADESEDFALYKAALKRILKPVINSGIPFGYVFGNHEHDAKQEELIIKAYDEYESCCVYNDDSSITGFINCCLPVRSSDNSRDAFVMWFIDSNNCCEDKNISNYDWVHKDQIDWYERKAEEYKQKNGKIVPAVLFQHIPVAEEYELLREAKLYELPVAVKGHHKWGDKYYVPKGKMDGYLGEGPCAPAYNDGQFDSWKKIGDIKGAFFGHDHLNDFTGNLDGILLGQNKTSGFNAYTDGCRSCVRLITLDENTEDITTRVYHFRDFGLDCHCLGPIMSHITDRQSMNMHKASYVAAGVAGITAASIIIDKLINKK